jgi:hypothetical protein
MGLIAAGPLEELPTELPEDRLHVFVAGPGTGEGIAVALPGGRWLLIDGCQTGSGSARSYPLQAIVERFRPYMLAAARV